jgi:hypothetical protein
MPDISWQQHENVFTSAITERLGAAIECLTPESWMARIETHDGDVQIMSEVLPDFETAVVWLKANFVMIEQANDHLHPQSGMATTFDLCATKLHAMVPLVHMERLAALRTWLTARTTHGVELATISQLQSPWKPTETGLDWQVLTPTDWYVDTPHGRAIIREQRPTRAQRGYSAAITHQAWIAHPSGAAYRWSQITSDFMVADAWVQRTLHDLEDPRVEETFLGNLMFTLDICLHLLTNEPDPVHQLRIDYVKALLEEVLP